MRLTIFEIQFVGSFFQIENNLNVLLILFGPLFFKFYWGIRTQQILPL